jgi:hypothetical protein
LSALDSDAASLPRDPLLSGLDCAECTVLRGRNRSDGAFGAIGSHRATVREGWDIPSREGPAIRKSATFRRAATRLAGTRPQEGRLAASSVQNGVQGRQTDGVDHLVRDVLEVAILVAVIGMLVSAVLKLRRGQITVVRCQECGRPTSRAYPRCKHCGAVRAEP